MKLSEKKREALYSAIHEPVMKIRVSLQMNTVAEDLDKKLHDLVIEIWRDQIKVLNLEGTP